MSMDIWRAGDNCHCVLLSLPLIKPKAWAVRASKVPCRSQTEPFCSLAQWAFCLLSTKLSRLFQHKDDWARTSTSTTRLGKDTSFCLAGCKGLINHLMNGVIDSSNQCWGSSSGTALGWAGSSKPGCQQGLEKIYSFIYMYSYWNKGRNGSNDTSEQPGSIRTVTESGKL